MCDTVSLDQPKYQVKTPLNLSPRISWLRDYYLQSRLLNWDGLYR